MNMALALVAFLSAMISGTVGMGGGVTLLAFMVLFMPLSQAIPIHGIVQLSSNLSRTFFLRRHVHLSTLLFFASGTPVGAFLAYRVLLHLQQPEWFLWLVIFLLLYVVFKPRHLPEITLNSFGFFVLGIFAAMLGPIIGATGPLLAPFFIRKDFPQESIVATKAACQICIHLIKIPLFLLLSFAYMDHLWLIISMLIAVILGTKVGTFLLGFLERQKFMLYVKVCMFLIAVRLGLKLLV